MIRFLFAASALTLAACAAPQDWAKKRLETSGRHQEWVDVKYGERTVKTFVVYPEVKEKATVVLVIHEIMGLTDWVMGVADQLAESGYIAVAPDLLSGMAPGGGRTVDFADVGAARQAISGLLPEQVTADLNAVADYGLKLPAASGKLAVSGFCWGGSQSFRFATNRKDLTAAFVYYGTGPSDADAIARISCPVYGFYGGNDNRVNATIPSSEGAMKSAGKAFEAVIYEGAGHGFMRSGEAPDASEPNKKAREEAWKRWSAILAGIK